MEQSDSHYSTVESRMYFDKAMYDYSRSNPTPHYNEYDVIRNDHRSGEYDVLGRLKYNSKGCYKDIENVGGEYESLQVAKNKSQITLGRTDVAIQPAMAFNSKNCIVLTVLLVIALVLLLLLTAALVATGMSILYKQEKIDSMNAIINESHHTLSELKSEIQILILSKNCSIP